MDVENQEDITMDALLSELGAQQPPNTETSESTESELTETEAGQTEETSESATEQTEETKSDALEESSEADKSAKAFAQMRIEKRKLEKTMKGVAEILGIQDTSNPENLTSAIQQKVIEAQAKQQNIPPEVLSRLHQLEELQSESNQNQIRQQAYVGFQKLKDTFNLSTQDLETFAENLQKNGINPFERPVDVVREYKLQNFDKLVSDAEARGIQKEIERANKAKAQSSNPGKNQGKQQGESVEKITTISDLETWMAQQSN